MMSLSYNAASDEVRRSSFTQRKARCKFRGCADFESEDDESSYLTASEYLKCECVGLLIKSHLDLLSAATYIKTWKSSDMFEKTLHYDRVRCQRELQDAQFTGCVSKDFSKR